MKKILILLLSMAFTFTVTNANAQTSLLSQYGNKIDTASNVLGTKYLTSGKVEKLYRSVTVYVDLTEISGTTGGTISLEVSGNGTTWAPYYNSKDSVYTFTPADQATNSFRFQIYDWGDLYLRVKYTPTGTMSDKITAYFITKN
jgi:hypothetical protein